MEYWKIGCVINLLILTYGVYTIINNKNEDNKKIFGCGNCYSVRLILSIYLSIILVSIYCLYANKKKIAKGLYMFQIIYKLIMFLLFDAYMNSIITGINVAMIPFLSLGFYLIF